MAADWQQTSQLLAQIQSGVYPLSPAEQQKLDSTTALFSQAITAQLQANANYSGGVATAMESSGLSRYAPDMAMGNIQAAIATGNQKITALDAQMTSAVSDLQIAWQKQDYDQVQQLWTDMSKQFDDRTTALDTMQKNVAAQIQSQKTDMQDFTNKAISALTSAATLANTNMNDAASRAITAANDANTAAYHQGTLDEKTYNDNQKLILEAQKTTVANAKQSALDNLSNIVTTNNNGKPLPGTNGIPVIDSNGFITPEALQTALAAAPSEGLTEADVINQLTPYIARNDDGTVMNTYKLNAALAKLVNPAS